MTIKQNLKQCTVCGGTDFDHQDVLWPTLVTAWQLSPVEVGYVNRQQGTHCIACHNNLREMALAAAVVDAFSRPNSTLAEFCKTGGELRVLEINQAANLTKCFSKLLGIVLSNTLHMIWSCARLNMLAFSTTRWINLLIIYADCEMS